MIKLSNLEKYFNKNRTNEIHVINDINLELPQKGLVILLGPSGSGKTTLLNVLGGLDKIHSGMIQIDDMEMKKYSPNKWDSIRNEHIGYIFQNYNLIHDLSVRDNISLTLNMVGIYDKDEIDKRVDYILLQMGMDKFKRRKASQLSGGQQQRVAIARSLAKNPKIIIADEPTGNLDSKNTYDIMNIIKSISKEKLVVLVTHERHLATQYADRIIELKDGQIFSDELNESTGSSTVTLETDIYLNDFNKVTDYKEASKNYTVFTDEESDEKLDVRLIIRNKTLYVDIDSDKYKRINLIDKNSEIKIYDESIKRDEEIEIEEKSFDLEDIMDDTLKTTRFNAISVKDSIRLGFRRFRNERRGVKFMNLMFIVISGFIALAISMIFNVFNLDVHEYFSQPVQTLSFDIPNDFTYQDLLELEDLDHIGYVNLASSNSFNINLPKVYQSNRQDGYASYSGVPYEFLDDDIIVYGAGITGHNQIVINEEYLMKLMRNNSSYSTFGITNVEDFLSLTISYKVKGQFDVEFEIEAEIVGISREDNPVYYATEETILSMKYNRPIYEMFEDELNIDTSSVSHGEYIISDEIADSLNQTITFLDEDYTADMTYTGSEDLPTSMFLKEHFKESIFEAYQTAYVYNGLEVYSTNKDATKLYLEGLEYEYEDTFLKQTTQQRNYNIQEAIGSLTFAGVFLVASSLSTFFILRSSLLSRIYEVSVYRALGAKKRDIKKLFLIEILMITTFTSMVGYMLVSLVIQKIMNASAGIIEVVEISPLSFAAGIVIIYVVNVISGMIPITSLLRSTPSQIMSRYDF